MANAIQRTAELGQEIWLDNISRGLLKSGKLREMVSLGISGLTANPTILEKAIIASNDYDEALASLELSKEGTKETYEALAIEDIRASADLFRPYYDSSAGRRGFACLEVSPYLAYDVEESVTEARRIFSAIGRPNAMPKIPATPQGMTVIRRLVGLGISVNVTLIFSLDIYRQVIRAYIGGIRDLLDKGGDPRKVASVASFFLSRIDTSVDRLLQARVQAGDARAQSLLGKTAVASARAAYQIFKEVFYGPEFAPLKERGAQVQRLLWASTSTKNPAYPELMYVEPLIGRDTVNTMPLVTIQAFLDHGQVEPRLEENAGAAEEHLKSLGRAGIDLAEVTARLLDEGVKAFSDSFDKLLKGIDEKKARLRPPLHSGSG